MQYVICCRASKNSTKSATVDILAAPSTIALQRIISLFTSCMTDALSRVLLSQRLGFSDIGASATVTVLSFVGDFAALTLMPPEASLASWQHGLLERSRIQQDSLGFSAVVAGDLLLQQWGLPPSVVAGIERAGALLVSPAPPVAGPDILRLALCYLSARIGESIAMGRVTEVEQINLSANGQPELFHLQSYLTQPAFAKLSDILQSPDVRLALARMIAAAKAHEHR